MNHDNDSVSGAAPLRDIYTVSRLNREIRTVLETGFPPIWLEGELSNLARPASGHLYFSLKDEAAQVRCAMFRNRNMYVKFTPDNGMQVLVRARISLYEARGEYQLIVEHMEEAGSGALRRAFDALKHKLEQQGLFAAEHKQTLPAMPRCIGVITSPTGAAIHDILTTLQRRFPLIPVIVYPVQVQGAGAADTIVSALRTASQRRDCDVLILARGGGSLEDLWSFNEESVARAIYDCAIPVVTGIGHEVDFTIADFVADVRAPTPTAAAELVSPNQFEWWQQYEQLQLRLQRLMQQQLRHYQQQVIFLGKRLPHPARYLLSVAQRLDELELRRGHAMHHALRHRLAQVATLHEKIQQHNPRQKLQHYTQSNASLAKRLATAMRNTLNHAALKTSHVAHNLDTVSPLATLSRGYAIVNTTDGQVISDAARLEQGQRIHTRLHKGRFSAVVDEVKND